MYKDSEKQSISINTNIPTGAEGLKMFKLAIENVDEHVVITDSNGIILYANKAAEQMTGYSAEEMAGQTPALWGRQMSPDFYKMMWNQIKVEKKHFSGEFINKRKNGELYTALGKISPVLDNDRTLLYFIAVERDVTKEKKATEEKIKHTQELERTKIAVINLLEDLKEEKEKVEVKVRERTKELSAEKAKLLASINSLPFGFIIADIQDNIIIKNPALYSILGIKEDPKSLRDIYVYFNKAQKGSVVVDPINICKKCIASGKVVNEDNIFYANKFLRMSCVPILDKVGSVEQSIGYALIIEDITDAKVMERSRDEFFSIASHELRTPLTAIRGNSEMLLDMYMDKIQELDMKEMLTDIHSASIRLIGIVNDFLEVSRIEQGKIEFHIQKFDVREVIQKVIKDMSDMARRQNITLTFLAPKKTHSDARGDKSRVEQVLINLVGNAIKFTKKGGVSITVEGIGGFIKVSVTDTGIGISPENQTRLFRKFQQAGESMIARDVTQGTGLGLYICHLLVSSMGGTIGIEKSELGKGSTFAFTIPIAV